MKLGICKLTGSYGKFVRSHIIPAALTSGPENGEPLKQAGNGTSVIRRWSSWYDRSIVTIEGEKILSQIDDLAIKELRNHRLLWSGFGPITSLENQIQKTYGERTGIRLIERINSHILRLFFLSILWRSAVSQLKEFSEINISENDIETLRVMITNNDIKPVEYFAVELVQLYNIGMIHNHTPMFQNKSIPTSDFESHFDVPIFRYYMDGLIAHINLNTNHERMRSLGNMILGNEEKITVIAVPFENSSQWKNLQEILAEADAFEALQEVRKNPN